MTSIKWLQESVAFDRNIETKSNYKEQNRRRPKDNTKYKGLINSNLKTS